MKKNRLVSVVVGAIIGFIVGCIFFAIPGKFLITGPIISDSVFIPLEVHNTFLLDMLKFGGIFGLVIGLLGGLVTPFEVPRGHLSRSIGTLVCLVVVALAWYCYWPLLEHISWWRIIISIIASLFTIVLCIPICDIISSLEKIRE